MSFLIFMVVAITVATIETNAATGIMAGLLAILPYQGRLKYKTRRQFNKLIAKYNLSPDYKAQDKNAHGVAIDRSQKKVLFSGATGHHLFDFSEIVELRPEDPHLPLAGQRAWLHVRTNNFDVPHFTVIASRDARLRDEVYHKLRVALGFA